MGLKERRAARQFEEGTWRGLLAQLRAVVGEAVEIEVRWDELSAPGMEHVYEECWPKVYFEPLIAGLEDIASDDMGREALSEGLRRIVVQNQGGVIYGDRWASFADGVLTLDHEPTTNASDVGPRTEGVVKALSDAL